MSQRSNGSEGELRYLRWLEYAAWVAGLALILLYGGARTWSEMARAQGLEALRQASLSLPFDGAAARPPAATREATALPADEQASEAAPLGIPSDRAFRRGTAPGPVDQSLWSRQRVLAFLDSSTRPGVPDGALRIPSLRLEVPIYPGATELNLNRGAARIEGTAPLAPRGNIGIAAHRDGFFRKLKDIGIDADIYIDVGDRTLQYRVVGISVVMPSDVHVIAPTDVPSVTLVTCYPFYFLGDAPQRYIVRAELADATDRTVAAAANGSRTSDQPLLLTSRDEGASL